WVSCFWHARYVLGAFNQHYHASKNPAATIRDTTNPCSVCGWAAHMAVHREVNFHVRGYGHAYKPIMPTVTAPKKAVAVKVGTKREQEMASLKVNLDQLVKEGKLTRNEQGLYGLPEWVTEKKPAYPVETSG